MQILSTPYAGTFLHIVNSFLSNTRRNFQTFASCSLSLSLSLSNWSVIKEPREFFSQLNESWMDVNFLSSLFSVSSFSCTFLDFDFIARHFKYLCHHHWIWKMTWMSTQLDFNRMGKGKRVKMRLNDEKVTHSDAISLDGEMWIVLLVWFNVKLFKWKFFVIILQNIHKGKGYIFLFGQKKNHHRW